MTKYDDLLVDVHDHRAIICINRPEVHNALRTQTYRELFASIEAAADDRTVGVIVVTGSGDKAFSSGGDIGEQRTRDVDMAREHLRHAIALAGAIRNCGKPVIAAVNGYAVGGGHELHLMCDLTIAADTAQFGQAGPRVGSVPIWGATQFLPSIVGEKRAREMLFLCRRYSAQQALQMGLVNAVVPLSQLMDEANAWCEEILLGSPQSIRLSKTALNYSGDLLYPAFTHGMEMLALTFGSDEQEEGVNAFLEKRRADFGQFRA